MQNRRVNDTLGLPPKLCLRIGARYMITVNIDTGGGLVNGVTGCLRRFDLAVHREGTGETGPLRIWLELDNERSGGDLRQKHRRLLDNLGITNWTP